MAVEFAMPKLGLTMESGTILRWLVPDATEVSAGDAVLLVETDKVETEIEASGSGVLHQTGEVGEEYLCGVRIGWFCEPGEDPPATAAAPSAAQPSPAASSPAGRPAAAATAGVAPVVRAPGERILASPAAKRLARELGVELAAVAGSGPGGRITERDVRAATEAPAVGEPVAASDAAPATGPSPPATLAARQLADLLGVDLRAVRASAPDGRISRADVAVAVREMLARQRPHAEPERPATSSGAEAAASAQADEAAPLAQEPTELIPLRGMRGVIAERMSASLASMAQLTLTMDVDMSAVVGERTALAAGARAEGPGDSSDEPVPGYTDYVVAAAAAALGEHPRVNSQVTADAVALLGAIHVGLAVALDDGLLVPVIRHADRLSLGEIAAETTRLAEGARNGSLGYDDYQGATFTVTALGPFGVDAFTPIINAPNTAILGVGRIRNETVWNEGAPEPRPTLTLSLTWDHRAFDGAPAARFTGAVRDWLESR
ncbi:2-oxo acid dehydrogenase subunit E2 [Candidatus Poriferisodalis sp.]|uniref:2-oxo acid dehydrogenase subunit E2 n=1 Tax=Candidatus Poriferisodalis sp. TaxID=3101277 RepID=UPI003B0146ED